jgi:phosphoribosylanthranilate isomerase
MTLLKLCGNHSLPDLQIVTRSKAEYIGVIFAESKRKVEPRMLAEWLKEVVLPDYQQLVGVFVNPTLYEIENVIDQVPLDVLQLHGNEIDSFLEEIKREFGLPLFKAIHHHPPYSFNQIDQLASIVDGFIVDSKVQGAWGGTGIKFDWEAIPKYVEMIKQYDKKCFIAGGIRPDNIEKCLVYHTPGIDLASGIERDGRKDEQLITQLEARLRAYEQSIS